MRQMLLHWEQGKPAKPAQLSDFGHPDPTSALFDSIEQVEMMLHQTRPRPRHHWSRYDTLYIPSRQMRRSFRFFLGKSSKGRCAALVTRVSKLETATRRRHCTVNEPKTCCAPRFKTCVTVGAVARIMSAPLVRNTKLQNVSRRCREKVCAMQCHAVHKEKTIHLDVSGTMHDGMTLWLVQTPILPLSRFRTPWPTVWTLESTLQPPVTVIVRVFIANKLPRRESMTCAGAGRQLLVYAIRRDKFCGGGVSDISVNETVRDGHE